MLVLERAVMTDRICRKCKTSPPDTKQGKFCRACREQAKVSNREAFVQAIWPGAKNSDGKEKGNAS
jgi:uncharacterized Zn finger protein (UPF0148 family)